MIKAQIKSYAKLNLALHVIGKTSFLHRIETAVAFISLHDEIFVKEIRSNKHNILFSGKFSRNISKNNTISELLKILEKKKLLKDKKFKIKIIKKIPNKAGLGGGSMNAASILKYFVKKGVIKTSKKELISISKSIGSDVVLGLDLKNSILNGRNEIKRFKNCKRFYTLIIKPTFGCSTKEIYSKVKKFNNSRFDKPNKRMFNFDYLKKMGNSLEQIVFSKYPKLSKIKIPFPPMNTYL